jgi:pilus assembly protein Flp/PilA
MIRAFLRNQDAATAIEYALIAAFIGLVIITAVATIGTKLTGVFTAVAAGFN